MSNHTPSADMMRRSVELPHAEHWVMRSRAGKRRYRIIAAQPMGQAPPSGYPVIYLLDGNSVFHTMVETTAPAVPQTGQNRDTAGGRSRYRLRDGGAVCSGPVL